MAYADSGALGKSGVTGTEARGGLLAKSTTRVLLTHSNQLHDAAGDVPVLHVEVAVFVPE
jgi:hypothetical protein